MKRKILDRKSRIKGERGELINEQLNKEREKEKAAKARGEKEETGEKERKKQKNSHIKNK